MCLTNPLLWECGGMVSAASATRRVSVPSLPSGRNETAGTATRTCHHDHGSSRYRSEEARKCCRLVPPRREVRHQPGRAQGALRVGRPTEGAMREPDFLTVAAQDDGVLTGIPAGAHSVDTDLT